MTGKITMVTKMVKIIFFNLGTAAKGVQYTKHAKSSNPVFLIDCWNLGKHTVMETLLSDTKVITQ